MCVTLKNLLILIINILFQLVKTEQNHHVKNVNYNFNCTLDLYYKNVFPFSQFLLF